MTDLIDIPVFDVGTKGPLGVVDFAPERFEAVMHMGQKAYGSVVLRLGDHFGRKWLHRNVSPLGDMVLATAARTPKPGPISLNLSYDFGCTTGIGQDPSGVGNRMLRTLDWPLKGLGREVVIVHHDGPSGPYYDVTWPGFVGVVTAMAPGRFSAAINQPPSKRHTVSFWFDTAINKWIAWKQTAIPPVHLLRQVFESSESYDQAKHLLTVTPLSIPVFFTLSGTDTDQGCVIERTETQAIVHEAPFSIANHWIDVTVPGRNRGADSVGRRQTMDARRDASDNSFDWVQEPILNPTTRLAVFANAAQSILSVRGYEQGRNGIAEPVTTDFVLQ